MLIINAAPPPSSDLIPGTIFQFIGTGINAGLAANVTNGSGLTPATPALTGIHALYTTSNGVQSANTVAYPASLLFTFPAVYWVTAMSFWQVTGINSGFGIRNFTIEYSLNGSSGWSQILGSPTSFAEGSGTVPSNPLQFSWNPVQAQFIRFVVSRNWGGVRIALSEVQFAGYL